MFNCRYVNGKKIASLLILTVLMFVNTTAISFAKDPGKREKAVDEEIEKVFSFVNEARAKEGFSQLKKSKKLEKDASIRAAEISEYFSHTRPNGEEWYTVDEKHMYGENLAKGYNNAVDVFDAWMKSKEHKENILYPDFKTMGIAVYIDKDGNCYWVQEFNY